MGKLQLFWGDQVLDYRTTGTLQQAHVSSAFSSVAQYCFTEAFSAYFIENNRTIIDIVRESLLFKAHNPRYITFCFHAFFRGPLNAKFLTGVLIWAGSSFVFFLVACNISLKVFTYGKVCVLKGIWNLDLRFCGAAFKCLVRGFIHFTYDWSTTLWPEVYEVGIVRLF